MKLFLLHCQLVLVFVSCQMSVQIPTSLPLFFLLNIYGVFYFSSLEFVLLLCT